SSDFPAIEALWKQRRHDERVLTPWAARQPSPDRKGWRFSYLRPELGNRTVWRDRFWQAIEDYNLLITTTWELEAPPVVRQAHHALSETYFDESKGGYDPGWRSCSRSQPN